MTRKERFAKFVAEFPGIWASDDAEILGTGPGWDEPFLRDLIWQIREKHPEAKISRVESEKGFIRINHGGEQTSSWTETFDTCEVCGKPGDLLDGCVWDIRVRCKEHFEITGDELEQADDIEAFLAERREKVIIALQEAKEVLQRLLEGDLTSLQARYAAAWAVQIVRWSSRDLGQEYPDALWQLYDQVEHDHEPLEPEYVRQVAKITLKGAEQQESA